MKDSYRITIRNVDPNMALALRNMASQKNVSLGRAFNRIVEAWERTGARDLVLDQEQDTSTNSNNWNDYLPEIDETNASASLDFLDRYSGK